MRDDPRRVIIIRQLRDAKEARGEIVVIAVDEHHNLAIGRRQPAQFACNIGAKARCGAIAIRPHHAKIGAGLEPGTGPGNLTDVTFGRDRNLEPGVFRRRIAARSIALIFKGAVSGHEHGARGGNLRAVRHHRNARRPGTGGKQEGQSDQQWSNHDGGTRKNAATGPL